MNTVLGRLNAAFAFTLSALACVTFICFLSTVMNDNLTNVEIAAGKVDVLTRADFTTNKKQKDLGLIHDLGVTVDLSKVFNWNVKQIFLYLVAEYSTKANSVNQVVLWDKIVMREDKQVLKLPKIHPKYYFFDNSKGGLKGNDNVTLTLGWNVIPNAGSLPRVRGVGSKVLQFPDQYTENTRY